jgi:hypothetical protein
MLLPSFAERIRAFSSEVDSGSREENAIKQKHGAFEVDGNPPKTL